WQPPPSPYRFSSSRGFGLEARMHDGAVPGQRRRLDDLVVPIDRERFARLVDEDLEEGVEILGIEARSGGGEPARHVAMADDFHAADLGHLAYFRQLAIAAALDREIDDHRARPHRAH